ncbi:MAG: ATP--guanido phosphotransferase [Phycisphaerae bacterium]|nr:ATP--guanido phosphotransferase [Phycisphaerae bacterium]
MSGPSDHPEPPAASGSDGPSGPDGPDSDVIISSRARIARNLDGIPFVNRANEEQCEYVTRTARHLLLHVPLEERMIWVDLEQSSSHERQLLVERHIISRHHADSKLRRGVAVGESELASVMVNEEDHIRIQVLRPGLQLSDACQACRNIDETIGSHVDYAFRERWGYLSACPTNVGTGIRLSVMLHLPALRLTNDIGRVRQAAKDLHLAVRGYFGEGSDSTGNYYQVSNQITLGRSEEEILDEFQETIIPGLVQYERAAREVLVDKHRRELEDRVFRALGTLGTARILKLDEAMKLLSRLRLGVCLDMLKEAADSVTLETIRTLMLLIQPGHLRQHIGSSISPEEARGVRADIVREILIGE